MLADLLELQIDPSEKSKMKNFAYKGTLQQNTEMQPNRFNMGAGGTIEGKGMIQTDHPENKEYQVGKSWDEPSLFEVDDLHDAILGREFQTLDDLAKMISRLRQAGYEQKELNDFILNIIN